MKLCVISNDFPAADHNAYIFVEQLVVAMADLGVEVSVVAPQSVTRKLFRSEKLFPAMSKVTTDQGGSYEVFRPMYISFGNIKWLSWLVRFTKQRAIKRVVNSFSTKPNVLYGHFWENGMVVMKYASQNNIPLFVACGEGDDALEQMVAELSSTQKAHIASSISGVICVSSENKRKCIDFGLVEEPQTIVLPNSVNQSLFRKYEEISLRTELGIKESDFVVIFVGGFIHRKGSLRVAEAIDKIDDTSIKVIFIGQPFAGDDCTPSCNGIIYKGAVSHSQLPAYLNCADVFVLPTLKEGCCNAIVEALSCGLPVISSNRPFNYDILNDENSIRIDPLDIDEIQNAIVSIKNDPPLRAKMSFKALESVRNLSISRRAEMVIEFITLRISNRSI